MQLVVFGDLLAEFMIMVKIQKRFIFSIVERAFPSSDLWMYGIIHNYERELIAPRNRCRTNLSLNESFLLVHSVLVRFSLKRFSLVRCLVICLLYISLVGTDDSQHNRLSLPG